MVLPLFTINLLSKRRIVTYRDRLQTTITIADETTVKSKATAVPAASRIIESSWPVKSKTGKR